MVLTRDLQQRRKRSRIRLDAMPYLLRNMLVYKQNRNVLALRGEAIESCLDGRGVGLGVYDKEVFLRVRGGGDVLVVRVRRVRCEGGVGGGEGLRLRPRGACRLLCPGVR